jgi:hypothetical protein
VYISRDSTQNEVPHVGLLYMSWVTSHILSRKTNKVKPLTPCERYIIKEKKVVCATELAYFLRLLLPLNLM